MSDARPHYRDDWTLRSPTTTQLEDAYADARHQFALYQALYRESLERLDRAWRALDERRTAEEVSAAMGSDAMIGPAR